MDEPIWQRVSEQALSAWKKQQWKRMKESLRKRVKIYEMLASGKLKDADWRVRYRLGELSDG